MIGDGASLLSHLECPECHREFDADILQSICMPCNSPLEACYDIHRAKISCKKTRIRERKRGLWRWAELLPVRNPAFRLTMGEGDTPLIQLTHLAIDLDLKSVWIKDEAFNPTGSFKARGLAVAVSRAVELGVREFFIPTAGNAGGALAAYAARSGTLAHIYMPADAPRLNKEEVRLLGADLTLVDGLINDAAHQGREDAIGKDWFDLSTFREPYRVEGKKTLGFELAETFDWQLPDVIIYPTGGGTGLIGMWKAFRELEVMGWIGSERPRMYSVQAEGCAPLVRAFERNAKRTEFWENAQTDAHGLRVPGLFADRQALRVLRESGGSAVGVSEIDIRQAQADLSMKEGLLVCPEGAATYAGLRKLLINRKIGNEERIILFNTGIGTKYLD